MNLDLSYDVTPSFVQSLIAVTVQTGGVAILTCRVCGCPRPSILWNGPDRMVLTPGPYVSLQYTESGLATLHLDNISPNISGEYTCTATNDLGSIRTTAKITVVNGEYG